MAGFGAWTIDGSYIPLGITNGGDYNVPGMDYTIPSGGAGSVWDATKHFLTGTDKGKDTQAKTKLSMLLAEVGFTGADLRTMTAVTMAEGKSEVDRNGRIICRANFAGCCWGPFQFNIQAGTADKETACDWRKGAARAYSLYKERGFQPWEAYTNGSYKRYLGQDMNITVSGGPVIADSPLDKTVQAVTNNPVAAAISAVADLISALFKADTWFRIGKTWLGGVLIVAGTGVLLVYGANKVSNSTPAGIAKKGAVKLAATKI